VAIVHQDSTERSARPALPRDSVFGIAPSGNGAVKRFQLSGPSLQWARTRALSVLVIVMAMATVWGLRAPPVIDRPGPFPIPLAIPPPVAFTSPYKNTRPQVAFVGDAVCARCHGEIAQTYSQHPMGRSMTTSEGVMPDVSGLVFAVIDLEYSIERRDGRVFHQETQRAPSGVVRSRTEAEVRYVIGSGTHGYSFVVERQGGLFQSPIAWYSRARKWDLAPTYRESNLHFDRKITPQCLFCHSNRFEEIERQPLVFRGLSIGCERCHGPGELHSRRPAFVDGQDLSIVNPAKLEPAYLRENVCEQCHFQGRGRVEMSDRSYLTYRPGLPLEEFLSIFATPYNPTKPNRIVGQVEQMRASGCFQRSGGKLGCTACHDPHRLPSPAERIAYYQNRCAECHTDRGCTLPREVRVVRSPEDDCTSCHMPLLPVVDVAHTALTNHSIPRQWPPNGTTLDPARR
jgi:hypothetical protein